MTPASGLPPGGRWGQVATVFRLLAIAAALATSLVTWLGGHYGGQRHVPVWLEVASIAVFVVTFVAAVGTTLADRKEKRTQQQAERLARAGRRLRCFPDNTLPLWSQLSAVDLGITPTRHTTDGPDPYVERPEADKQLVDLVGQSAQPYPFVVVVGASKAGKSRTAAQAVETALGAVNPQVVLPVSGEALVDLMQLDPPLFTGTERTVVWLDNLLTADVAQLTTNVLDAVAKHAVLVATITDQRYDEILHRGGDITTAARIALRRAKPVRLAFALTDRERRQARKLYPHEDVTVSIGEALVGGESLASRLDCADKTEPVGAAVVRAAVDARRAGLSRPITTEELRALYPLYLHRIRIDLEPKAELVDRGLAWARQPLESQVALMKPAPAPGGDAWEVFDFVVAAADKRIPGLPGRELPEQIWPGLLAVVSTDDALDIGVAAYLRDRIDEAIAAFSKACGSEREEVREKATNNLQVLHAKRGDKEGARAAYQAIIDSGHPAWARRAMANARVLDGCPPRVAAMELAPPRQSALIALYRALQKDTGQLRPRVRAVPRMVRAALRRQYRGAGRLLLIGLACAYIPSPLDLIPDVLPGVGQIDDLLVALYALGAMLDETERFLRWEDEWARARPGQIVV
jgi:uncharacterized membrane protein YkvA (DUF1232 family)